MALPEKWVLQVSIQKETPHQWFSVLRFAVSPINADQDSTLLFSVAFIHVQQYILTYWTYE